MTAIRLVTQVDTEKTNLCLKSIKVQIVIIKIYPC